MSMRESALDDWLKTLFPQTTYRITSLAGDASFRRYYRLHLPTSTRVIMDAPPEKISLMPFIDIAKQLTDHGLNTPSIHATEMTHGFLLLDDFGDELFSEAIGFRQVDPLYQTALKTLAHLQQCRPNPSSLPTFDQTLILNELSLFQDWFLTRYLQIDLNESEQALLKETYHELADALLSQPTVFVHRDYHSRNLLVLPTSNTCDIQLGIIDFQDAMIGPFTYDLVSLLKDCYVQWPKEKIDEWLTFFYHKSVISDHCSLADFRGAFDLCGLQRHIRILGTFARLHLRDHKSNYLANLPLTFNYVMTTLERYQGLASFHTWMLKRVQKAFLSKN